MKSFPSLPPPDDVASFISYVPICIASMASQDAPLASLLVVGLCFQTLWACVEMLGCICSLNQVGRGFVALFPGLSLSRHLWVLHSLFQLVPALHGCGCLFTRGLQILLQTLFWFWNWLPPSMGQFLGVSNRKARTFKMFPICRSLFHYPIGDAFVPNSEITFLLNANEGWKPCQ